MASNDRAGLWVCVDCDKSRNGSLRVPDDDPIRTCPRCGGERRCRYAGRSKEATTACGIKVDDAVHDLAQLPPFGGPDGLLARNLPFVRVRKPGANEPNFAKYVNKFDKAGKPESWITIYRKKDLTRSIVRAVLLHQTAYAYMDANYPHEIKLTTGKWRRAIQDAAYEAHGIYVPMSRIDNVFDLAQDLEKVT